MKIKYYGRMFVFFPWLSDKKIALFRFLITFQSVMTTPAVQYFCTLHKNGQNLGGKKYY